METAPKTPLTEDGTGRFGTYRGVCETTALDALTSSQPRLKRFLREKRWQWFGFYDKQVAVGGALVDAGLANSVFLWVYDRRTKRMLADESSLLPPGFVKVGDEPGAGKVASVSAPNRKLEFRRDGEQTTLEGSFCGIELELEFEVRDERAITAVCPVGDDGDGVNVTQKETGLSVTGQVRVAQRRFELADDALGMLDYTHGLLERETTWRWAIANGRADDGTRVGFNVVADFNEGLENVIWVGDTIYDIGKASFDFDPKRPKEPWRVSTEDGLLDVTMDVEAVRKSDIDLGIAASSYLQPLGRWHGKVDGRLVHGIYGVAEDHRAKW